LEKVCGHNTKINEWQLTQRISLPGVVVYLSVLEISVHDEHSVVTTQLQQEPLVAI